MKVQKILWIMFIACLAILSSCSSKKLVSKKNKFYHVHSERVSENDAPEYYITEQITDACFYADIEEKTDYINIIIKPKDEPELTASEPKRIEPDNVDPYIPLLRKYYYSESDTGFNPRKSFIYYDVKFGLQALTVPLKFRKGVGNDTINPPNVETGFNVGFAPGWKFTMNIYKPTKNYLGKNTTYLAVAIGPHVGLGATDLKKDGNAPGLLSNRKSPMLTYGLYAMLGFNNINVGYAWGKDYVTGTGADHWVYQGKSWHGVIVSLDILKF